MWTAGSSPEANGSGTMMKIALMGAGGKMGCRIADNLIKDDQFDVRYIEVNPAGIERLAQRGLAPTPQDEALHHAEAVILAVPDALLGKITHEIAPVIRSRTMIVTLDPAAAYAGALARRDDLTYFIARPCHPPLFNDETDPGSAHRLVRRCARPAAHRLRAAPRPGGGLRQRRAHRPCHLCAGDERLSSDHRADGAARAGAGGDHRRHVHRRDERGLRRSGQHGRACPQRQRSNFSPATCARSSPASSA